MNVKGLNLFSKPILKNKKVLASVEELIEEGLVGQDSKISYHGRKQQLRPKKKFYFKIHEESFE